MSPALTLTSLTRRRFAAAGVDGCSGPDAAGGSCSRGSFEASCPAVDPDDHHSFFPLGCAAENLTHAALAHGLQADIVFDVTHGRVEGDALRLQFEPTKAIRSDLCAAMFNRQCTRADFDCQPLSVDELKMLERAGSVVAMTGDGVNDAPALKAADIGIFDSIRKVLRYLLSSNKGEALTVLLGVVVGGVLGLDGAGDGDGDGVSGAVVLLLLATQILWINLITDSGPALAMGVDPSTDDVMARKPRGHTERVIDTRMWLGVIQIGVVMALATLLTLDIFLPGGMIEGSNDLATARTTGFTVLVLAQLLNCFNARSDSKSALSHLFVNRRLWGAIALSLALQAAVVHLGFLNLTFGTAPLSLEQWLLCVAMASVVPWYSELRKLVVRIVGRRLRPSNNAPQPVQP